MISSVYFKSLLSASVFALYTSMLLHICYVICNAFYSSFMSFYVAPVRLSLVY